MSTLSKTEDLRGHFEDFPNAILTYTGRIVEPLNPDPETIDIEDIAHALSNQCRYTGHTRFFYSVAQHCLFASVLAPADLMLEALLHDASEAYLSDMARPIKKHPDFGPFYLEAEERLERAIAERFGLKYPWPERVKEIDTLLLNTEALQLMPENFPVFGEPFPLKIEYTPPPKAKREFLARYEELT